MTPFQMRGQAGAGRSWVLGPSPPGPPLGDRIKVCQVAVRVRKASRQVGEDGEERHANQRSDERRNDSEDKGEEIRILVGLLAQAVGNGDDVAVVGQGIQGRGSRR